MRHLPNMSDASSDVTYRHTRAFPPNAANATSPKRGTTRTTRRSRMNPIRRTNRTRAASETLNPACAQSPTGAANHSHCPPHTDNSQKAQNLARLPETVSALGVLAFLTPKTGFAPARFAGANSASHGSTDSGIAANVGNSRRSNRIQSNRAVMSRWPGGLGAIAGLNSFAPPGWPLTPDQSVEACRPTQSVAGRLSRTLMRCTTRGRPGKRRRVVYRWRTNDAFTKSRWLRG